MNGVLALAMAVSGGFFGTLVAITMAYFLIRAIVVTAIKGMMAGAHAAGVCPACKQSMKHDEPIEVDDGRR